MRPRLMFPLLLCLWPGLGLGQTQSANTKDSEPSKQDAKPCVSKEAAQEVLRLGRSLGYPDDEIVEAYAESPCATLSYLRQEAHQKGPKPFLSGGLTNRIAGATSVFVVPSGATQQVEILNGKASVSFNPTKWKETKSAEAGRRTFQHVNGDGYAMIISERIQIPTDRLREIALDNAREVAPDVKVVEEQRRRVNGTDVLMMRLEGTANGVPFTYLGYYYGGPAGTIQVITYTGQNLFDEYRRDFEEFLNGFRVQQ